MGRSVVGKLAKRPSCCYAFRRRGCRDRDDYVVLGFGSVALLWHQDEGLYRDRPCILKADMGVRGG
jgi:hypothetical protein